MNCILLIVRGFNKKRFFGVLNAELLNFSLIITVKYIAKKLIYFQIF